LTGQDGVGKTVVAAQLAKAIAVNKYLPLLEASPHWSTQLSAIRFDLCNQARWIVKGDELQYGVVVN